MVAAVERWVYRGTTRSQVEQDQEWDESWRVLLTAPPVGPEWPILLADRPQFRKGHPHETERGAVVAGLTSTRVHSRVFDAVVRYERLAGAEKQEKDVLRRREIRMRSKLVEVPVLLDDQERPILNTAGDLVVGETDFAVHWVFSVLVNVPAVPRWLNDFPGKVNKDAVRIWGLPMPPEHLRCMGADVDDVKYDENDQAYYPLAMEFEFNPLTWAKRTVNRGLREIIEKRVPDPDNAGGTKIIRGEPVRIEDANGDPVEEPQLLDREGRRPRYFGNGPNGEKPGTVITPFPLADVHIIRWFPITAKRVPFSPLTFLR